MVNVSKLSQLAGVIDYLNALDNQMPSFRRVFELIAEELRADQGGLVTTLPRGGLQMAQSFNLSEGALRGYGRDFHSEDRATWAALSRWEPVRAREAWPQGAFEESNFARGFLSPGGAKYLVVVPIASPVLRGYAGGLQIMRSAAHGAFSDQELVALQEVAAAIEVAIERAREARRTKPGSPRPRWARRLPTQQFVFDAKSRARIAGDALAQLDGRLRDEMLLQVRRSLEHMNGDEVVSDRLQLHDDNGALWTFTLALYQNYPALGEGPAVFVGHQPTCCDWRRVSAADFQGDAEFARLIPALEFMGREFHRGPTLSEIAKVVGLSPFHFHRRFTELMGFTPKHFLLDCQIHEAKKMLIAAERPLAAIATACGFAHQSHFTSRFKQATGLTPTRWRRLSTTATPAIAASSN